MRGCSIFSCNSGTEEEGSGFEADYSCYVCARYVIGIGLTRNNVVAERNEQFAHLQMKRSAVYQE